MTTNFAILAGRVIKKYMPFFARFAFGLERHIKHKYDNEMAQKSEVVPLGIMLKNEMKYEEMIEVMKSLQKYVPKTTTVESIDIPGSSDYVEVPVDTFHYILFGGDMLTAARARGSQAIRSNSERGIDRLEGLQPVVEDWHGKLCLLEVIWKRLYRVASGKDGGTLYQLRNLINRRNLVKKPKKNVTACEEFFELVVEAHIICAAMQVFGMETVDDEPSNSSLFPEGSADLNPEQRKKIFLLAVKQVVDRFVDISFPAPTTNVDTDHIRAYAREVLSLGLLFLEFTDAIREGDGLRILRCWRYFLPLFKATKRTNYSVEAFTMLAQYHFFFSPRMQEQLLWSRTVNTQGRAGRNILCDLHTEHLNRACKNAIGTLELNVNCESSIVCVGKSIGALCKVMANFDRENRVPLESENTPAVLRQKT